MGTYTANYNLFLPTIGEQGWGELVNGNFSTIDITMKELNTHIETLEAMFDSKIGALEDVVDTTTGTVTVNSIVYRNVQTVNVTPSEYTIGYSDPIYILPFRGENFVYAGTLKFRVGYTNTPCIYFYNIDGTMSRYLGAKNNSTTTRTDTIAIPNNTSHAYGTHSIHEWYVPLFS